MMFMRAGRGQICFYGALGNDALRGGAGADTIYAGEGKDRLFGGTGRDWLFGGPDEDRLTGGPGGDRFIFADQSDTSTTIKGADTITDFGRGDKLDLSLIDANTTVTDNQSFTLIGREDFHNVAGELRFERSGNLTLVSADTNGDGVADMIVVLEGRHHLHSDAFIL